MKQKGFTLIEVLIVISIIGLITTVLVASLRTTRLKSRDTRRFADVEQMVTALQYYYLNHGNYPCQRQLIEDNNPNFLLPLINEGLLQTKIKDPRGSSGYHYQYYTFKNTAGGPCGQNFYIGIFSELNLTKCPLGGKLVSPTHCHIFYPAPRNCSEPWGIGGEDFPPADCRALDT